MGKMHLRAKNTAEQNVKNRPLDTRVRDSGEGGGIPGTEAKVPLQPAERWSRLFSYTPWGASHGIHRLPHGAHGRAGSRGL